MSEWKYFRKKYYGKDIYFDYNGGVIDFKPDSMDNVENGAFLSYDEYPDVQLRSCGKSRRFFELCCYHGVGAFAYFKGRILRFDNAKGRVLFKRILVDGIYGDGIGFRGKEDHVWMDKAGFEQFEPDDCVCFEAEIYRYMRKQNGKLIDCGLRSPEEIEKIESYEVPTDEELVDQQIDRLVCET